MEHYLEQTEIPNDAAQLALDNSVQEIAYINNVARPGLYSRNTYETREFFDDMEFLDAVNSERLRKSLEHLLPSLSETNFALIRAQYSPNLWGIFSIE